MSEEAKPAAPIPMSDPKRTAVIFVNNVAGAGFLNGVVNLTFGTANYTPTHDSSDTLLDMQVSSRLRMDLYCATILRDTLTNIIEQNTKAMPEGELN